MVVCFPYEISKLNSGRLIDIINGRYCEYCVVLNISRYLENHPGISERVRNSNAC